LFFITWLFLFMKSKWRILVSHHYTCKPKTLLWNNFRFTRVSKMEQSFCILFSKPLLMLISHTIMVHLLRK
jgi:hypothetical protein